MGMNEDTLKQYKSKAYDLLVQIEYYNKSLQEINKQIFSLSKIVKEENDKKSKKSK